MSGKVPVPIFTPDAPAAEPAPDPSVEPTLDRERPREPSTRAEGDSDTPGRASTEKTDVDPDSAYSDVNRDDAVE